MIQLALIHCNFFSESLGISTAMYVILPQETKTQIGMQGRSLKSKHPTLYLLHGFSDDYTIWLRRTSIERYVAEMGLAVVMPAVNLSFYTDMAHGAAYWTFVSEELPAIARSFFPLSEAREDTFAAGLSMGGYGAVKLGLRCPDKFSAVASLSGVLDIADHAKKDEKSRIFTDIFGDPSAVKGSENDLLAVAERLAKTDKPKPAVFQCVGTEDFLYENNIHFRDRMRELSYDITYQEEPGTHEWGYWDRKIQDVLKWLPLHK